MASAWAHPMFRCAGRPRESDRCEYESTDDRDYPRVACGRPGGGAAQDRRSMGRHRHRAFQAGARAKETTSDSRATEVPPPARRPAAFRRVPTVRGDPRFWPVHPPMQAPQARTRRATVVRTRVRAASPRRTTDGRRRWRQGGAAPDSVQPKRPRLPLPGGRSPAEAQRHAPPAGLPSTMAAAKGGPPPMGVLPAPLRRMPVPGRASAV